MHQFSLGTRVRQSPYYDATVAAGVVSFTSYNRMMMPTGYGDPIGEYWRLIEGVSMWDVAVERQIELNGPDAARLAQILSPRDISKCKVGQGRYVPVVDHDGVLLNDPVLLKLSDTRFWFSIADSDFVLWARAVARERRLDVRVFEADAAPLAVQGPRAEDVVASIFGERVRAMKLFWFEEVEVEGIPLVLARSGWSKQGGFELYLTDPARATELWSLVAEAGAPHGIAPGTPNGIERIESGLLSFGSDTDPTTNPFEVRLGQYTSRGLGPEVIGAEALDRIAAEGPARRQLGVVMESGDPFSRADRWRPIRRHSEQIGHVTASAWSPRLHANIGMALVAADAEPGQEVRVAGPDGDVAGVLRDFPLV